MPRARSFVSDVISQSTAPPTTAFVRQYVFNNWRGQNALGDPQSLTQAVALPSSVLAGSTIAVFSTLSNGGATGTPPGLTDTPNGAAYTLLEQVDDIAQLQSLFLQMKQNSAAGAYALNLVFANVEWQGVAVLEIANVPAASLIAHASNLQTGVTSTATDLITSTAVAGAGNKALLIGHGQSTADSSVANGGSGLGRPNHGTGFSTVIEIWNLLGGENTSNAPSALIEAQSFASMGNVAATFTGTGGTDNLGTIAFAVKSN